MILRGKLKQLLLSISRIWMKFLVFAKKLVQANALKFLIYLFIFAILIVINGFSSKDYFDGSMIFSFIFVFIVDSFVSFVINVLTKRTEDVVKISDDYEDIIKKILLRNTKYDSL